MFAALRKHLKDYREARTRCSSSPARASPTEAYALNKRIVVPAGR